jgi:glycosyltransferase involved in cell wall biosynthesis
MHICHITTFKVHDPRIYYRMCYGLAEHDVSVTLIAPQTTPEDPVVRLSVFNGRLAQVSRARRLGVALRAALAEHADVYHIHEQELIPIGMALKILRPSAAVVFDAREDYPGLMRAKYWVPKLWRSQLALLAQAANRVASLGLDGIVAADPAVAKDFQSWGTRQTCVYYNFPTLPLFSSERVRPPAAPVDLVYVGGMSERTGMFVVLDALALLAQEGLRPTVRLAGYTDGARGLQALREGIACRQLTTQVELRGPLPYGEVPAWIRSGRIGLVPLQPLPKFMKNISTKTFEYWACGLPVIASDLPPIRPFLTHGYNGVLFKPSHARALARAMRAVLEAPEQCAMMGRHGQQQVYQTWNNNSQATGLQSFYQQFGKTLPSRNPRGHRRLGGSRHAGGLANGRHAGARPCRRDAAMRRHEPGQVS